MKTRKRIIISIIVIISIIIIILTKNNYKSIKLGNNISNRSADNIKENILNMESYQATATITIKSNKNENCYVVKQKYDKKSNLYKQEIIEPQGISGVQFEYNGETLKIENSKLNLVKIYENYNYIANNNLNLISFVNDYNTSNNAKYYEEDDKIILETEVENGNKYIISKKAYINKQQGKVEKIEIMDGAQNVLIYILYNEIEINTSLKM